MRFLLFVFLVSCGAMQPTDQETVIVYEDEEEEEIKAYAWSDLKAACFTCHNSSAPKIPLEEDGFKTDPKVKARIENGSMPPNPSGFDKKRALKYLEG